MEDYILPSLYGRGFCPPINGGTEGGVKTIEGGGSALNCHLQMA